MKTITQALKRSLLFISIMIAGNAFAQTVISNENFETAWGIWNDGGADCARVNGNPINGTWAIELRDNSGAASTTTTNNINLTTYASVSFAFDYRSTGFNNNHDFFLQFSNNGGTSWTTILNYKQGFEFFNDINNSESVSLTNTVYAFGTNSRFRIICDAKDDSNLIYFDNIVITGFPPIPEIDITGNGATIVNGDLSPNPADNTDFGSSDIGVPITRNFVINSLGNTPLILTGTPYVAISGSAASDFTVTAQPTSPISVPSGSSTFTVRFNPTTLGTRNAILTIASNDSDENPYTFRITGNGTAPSSEIDIRGNNISIPDGDTTPNPLDNTDYGSVNDGTIIIKTFTIHNLGSNPLYISGITLSNNVDFSVVGTPYTSPIPAGGTTSYNIRFKTLTLGLKSTVVTVLNNDLNEAVYDYVINAETAQNFFDSDGDGVFDNVDIDDDNDGIIDTEEELACENTSISHSVNYKFLNEDFGTGIGRTTINTNNYRALTTYCYEDGIASANTPACPFQSSWILDDGEYCVVSKITGTTANDPENIHGDLAWTNVPDHTPGDVNGRMAVFNASFSPGVFYETDITGVLSNIPITYNFWAMNIMAQNLYPGSILPNITIEFVDFSNNVLASFNTGTFGRCLGSTSNNSCAQNQWHQFTTSVNLGNVTDFKVRFINNAPGGGGNDLAIDDIVISQTLCDYDGDGVADVFDLDADNDGIPDVVEAGLGDLSEGKATLTGVSTWVDTNGNGMHDLAEGHITLDSDGDGAPNYIDLDSDNDTIFDVDESGAGNTGNLTYQNGDGDIDGDGVGDGPDTDAVRETDVNSDNISEYYTDGILDIYDYYNGATMASAYGNNNQGNGYTYFVVDSDNDGLPDYIDTTSDGSNYDISKTLYAHLDANNDGVIDDTNDSDDDGILDLFDTDDAAFGSPRDLNRKLHLYFDGRNDYAEDTNLINGWGEVTMMGWIKLDPYLTGQNQRVMGHDRIYLQVNSNRTVGFFANGNTIGSPRIPTNQWVHIAGRYSASNGTMTLYVNGAEINSYSIAGSLSPDTTLFTLGRRAGVNSTYFKGYMDEIRVFDKALSTDEIRKMVYQEIDNNSGIVRGEIIPRDITDYIDFATIVPLNWSNLRRYFRLDTYKGDIIDDLTTPTIDTGTGCRIYNHKIIDVQSAPLPFVTQQSGLLPTALSIAADGVNGNDAITYDWSIVKVVHDDIYFGAYQKHLGLIIDATDAASNPINYVSQNDSEVNVSWYLKLDGDMDLQDESQLVQNDDSVLDVTSAGKIQIDQQGTADLYTYNYWCSPVGISNTTSNNNSYTVQGVLRDGTNPSNPGTINFVNGYNGSPGPPMNIAKYWIWKFNNLPDDDYSAWVHVFHNGNMNVAEGFTMKGPGSGSISTPQNYTFEGKPNNGEINLTINAGNDYLVGNPYPSAMDAVRFIEDNGYTLAGADPSITGTLYFWEHWGGGSHNLAEYQGGYATFNLSGGTPAASFGTSDPDVSTAGTPTKLPGRYIPVGQGFFVVGENTGTIRFTNRQRLYSKENPDNSTFIRNSSVVSTNRLNDEVGDTRIKFRLGMNSIGTLHRQILLTIDENTTDDFDWGYDAPHQDVQDDDMYWMINDEKYNIQARSNFDISTAIPLGIHTATDGENTITLDALENVDDDQAVYLHDMDLDIFHNLRDGDYTFNVPAGEYLNRFELVFNNGENLSIEDVLAENLDVYYVNDSQNLVLANPKMENIKSLELLNVIGQSIVKINNIQHTELSEYPVKNLSTGSYIIKIFTDDNISVTKKVLVK